jgi:hypothetical protein
MDWQVVSKKSKSRIRSHQTGTKTSDFRVSFINFQEILEKCKNDSSFQQMKEDLTGRITKKVVSVGIGNFSSSLYSLSQQALFEAVSEEGSQVYDPDYLLEEVEYLKRKGFDVNPRLFFEFEEEEVTFFMVHCHFSLYQTLLAKDWVGRSRVVIFGNSLESIKKQMTDPQALKNAEKFKESRFFTDDLAFSDTFVSKNFD